MSSDNPKMEQMQAILRKSLVTIKKLEAEMDALKKHRGESVAIVGIGLRLPGGVHTIDDLWQMMVEKRDAVQLIPEDRWDREATYDPDPLKPGKSVSRHGAFLDENVKTFDAGFFGISPREAKSIDPIQRMLLEVTHEALERAGIAPSALKGTKTGVFLGVGSSTDYAQASLRSGRLETVSVYDTTGIPLSTAAGRLSYQFDLKGPSYAVDAACSSAATAIHLAAESLRTGDCSTAIAGSANLMLTPELFIGLSKMGSLSPDGVCRAFDEHANGYVRGEGCGVVLLKRLSDAQRDGDTILAVVRGSAVEHDGLSNGFTAPNPTAQASVIHKALEQADVDPASVGFVETHGVGNKFTDALEIQALEAAYGHRSAPLYVGSVKPNIGHMEAAVGMAMVAKVLGAFQHKVIPPNTHLETLNTDIDWNASPIRIPQDTEQWPVDGPLRAAVNASAYSGTNAHLLLEAPPEPVTDAGSGAEWPAYPVFLSARSEAALRELATAYSTNACAFRGAELKDISFTLACGRSHYPYKLSVVVQNRTELEEALKAWLEEGKHKLVNTADADQPVSREVAMLFTGQGAQYPGMCKSLYDTEPVFRETVDRCDAVLQPLLGRSIAELMYGEDKESIHQTKFTQPALYVVEYALSELWRSWGLRPAAVAGHSVGEYVALTVAGVLSPEDALTLIAVRGKFIQSLPEGEGAMAAVLAEAEALQPFLEGTRIDIAAINSPKSLTVSGQIDEIGDLVARLKEARIKAIPLTVSHAFHSYQMEPVLAGFEAEVGKVTLHAPLIPVMSNVTGRELRPEDLTPSYFSRHIRGTVRFMENVQALESESGIRLFLEAGPNPTLTGLARQCITSGDAVFLSSARKGQEDHVQLLNALQGLYLADVRMDWKAVYGRLNARRVSLPTYPWQREEYWYNPVHGLGGSTTGISTTVAIEGAPETVSKENLMELMQKIACRILGLPKGKRLDEHRALRDQGFDSMMSGELLAVLEKYLNTELEMSLIHVYGDLDSLHNYLLKEVLGSGEQTITLSDVMFDDGSKNSIADDDEEDWHTVRPSDGPLLRWFKKVDKMLGVDEKG